MPRVQDVTYRIHPSGGSTDIRVNQQQPSGGWYHLGMYTMSPGQSHRVEVEGALEGTTVADAVRFVSSGVSAPGIAYVHADHLGSPQKMTDSTKAIVWDAVYTPFGQVYSITGTATNNQRFPGQYADAETGYSYNYFRDYDPTTGRYVESDPIGLGGGLNTYGYVGGSPMALTDRFGLQAVSPFPGFPPIPLPPQFRPGTPENQELVDALEGAINGIRDSLGNLRDSIFNSRAIPKPKAPRCGCTCICRADADDNVPGNIRPGDATFKFGTHTAPSCAEASKEAKKQRSKAQSYTCVG